MTAEEVRRLAADLPPTVSITRAAQLLGKSRTALYREIHNGKCPLPLIRGATTRIPTAALLRLLGLDVTAA